MLRDPFNSKDLQKEVLFKFVCKENIESVKLLLSNGIDINITNDSKVTALDIACETNNYHMVKFLLDQGINFDTQSSIGIIPIQAAAMRIAHEDGDIRIIEALLLRYKETRTPLSMDILIDVDIKLQHGPSYLEDKYIKLVTKILGQRIESSRFDLSPFE